MKNTIEYPTAFSIIRKLESIQNEDGKWIPQTVILTELGSRILPIREDSEKIRISEMKRLREICENFSVNLKKAFTDKVIESSREELIKDDYHTTLFGREVDTSDYKTIKLYQLIREEVEYSIDFAPVYEKFNKTLFLKVNLTELSRKEVFKTEVSETIPTNEYPSFVSESELNKALFNEMNNVRREKFPTVQERKSMKKKEKAAKLEAFPKEDTPTREDSETIKHGKLAQNNPFAGLADLLK